ncbi:high osmolarity signaling protein SHO1 [Striga asiatica]|uniref:High osmolarity signaling protein SHO1 n=1 Tax=Striga asiatica TaxID=4170 RepID=A0A5A7PL65_STRAF|nr:high osmolarity signaling protein SHO1 [Striga asiatica]
MGYKDDLIRIGRDGFGIIEEHLEKKGGRVFAAKKLYAPQRPTVEARQPCLYQYKPQQAHVYHVKPLSENETRLNKFEVVDFRGVSIKDNSNRTSGSMFY